MKNRKQGFTLVEIMIVVMIIGLLAALAIPSMQKARDNAQEKTCINNLRQIKGAVQMYATEYNKASTDGITNAEWTSIQDLLDDNTPTCPYGDDAYAKPANYNSDPACPNVATVAEHVLPS